MSESEEQVTADVAPEDASVEEALDSVTEAVAVATGNLGELAISAAAEGAVGMAQLLDMPVKVTVEVGRVRVQLGDLCKLGPGSMLKLDREAHEPAEILVNGKVVARGEIVTINESYGIRISEVIS